MTSSLEISDKLAQEVQKTPNRVSLQDLEDNIKAVEYYSPKIDPLFTMCVIQLKNGFVVTGESAAADPLNFDIEIGHKFAREAAIRKIWPLMGYSLREKLAN